MRSLLLLVTLASTCSWAAIPKKFYGSYTGFESKAVYRGAAPDQAEISISINETGITFNSAKDDAGRRWLYHFAQQWIHPLEPQLGIRCFDLKQIYWDESKFRICFNTFLFNQSLPSVTLSSGSQMSDPIAQLFPHGRILGGQPVRRLRTLYAQMKNRGDGFKAPANRLNRDLLLSQWAAGGVELKQKVLRIALRKIDRRSGADQIDALDFARLGLNSKDPVLQKQVLGMILDHPRVSQFSEILSDLLTTPQILDHEVLDRAVMAAVAVAGEARAITEARSHLQGSYGSEILDDVFALRLGVVDAAMVPHLFSVLNFGGQTWSAEQRVTLLTTLYRLANEPSVPPKVRSDAGRAYVTDLAYSNPYIGKLCAFELHGNSEAYSTSGSESIIDRAQ